MGMSAYWMDEHERILDELCSGKIDEIEARNRLVRLGFDQHEAQDQIDTVMA